MLELLRNIVDICLQEPAAEAGEGPGEGQQTAAGEGRDGGAAERAEPLENYSSCCCRSSGSRASSEQI